MQRRKSLMIVCPDRFAEPRCSPSRYRAAVRLLDGGAIPSSPATAREVTGRASTMRNCAG